MTKFREVRIAKKVKRSDACGNVFIFTQPKFRLCFFSSHADLNDFERGGALGRKMRRQVTAEQL